MPRDDVLLSPRTSAWSVRPDLPAARPADAAPSALVAPIGEGEGGDGPLRDAVSALGLDPEAVLATHEPASTAGTVTIVPLLPGSQPPL